MVHVIMANYNQNPNIGLFCYANDNYCLVPNNFPKALKKEFQDILKVPVYEINAAGTPLLGVFFNGNNDILFVPEIMFESELKELEKLNIKYKIINSELTALGNNFLFLGNNVLANPDYKDSLLKDLEKNFNLKIKKARISELNIVGSLAKGNNKGLLVSPDIKEFELKFLNDFLKKESLNLKITKGTLNFGSPYISSALLCNSNGFIVGDISTGVEIQNADEALGFI
ncbi:MAG: translation initiation factor IF-6 [Candidatus Woesearchaeota archaeon]